MTAIKSNDVGRRNGKLCQAARLLRNEEPAFSSNSRATHETHAGICVLTQAWPGALHDGETSMHKAATLECGTENGTSSATVCETGMRIACIDRVIIRMYFHPDEAGAFEPREKGARVARRAAGHENRDAEFLPEELERMLTPLSRGYSRILRGNAVLLVEDGTFKVLDAVRNVAVREAAHAG